ncbi:hypothetical protein LINPERPRIM_LOCUS6358, partial [Linum perenne]
MAADLVTSGCGGGSGYERRRWRIWLRAAAVEDLVTSGEG